jgi:hypothetical protein
MALYLIVISKVGQKFHSTIFDPHTQVGALSSVLRDLRNDGRTELVFQTNPESSDTTANSPHVYEYRNGKFVNTDSHYQ